MFLWYLILMLHFAGTFHGDIEPGSAIMLKSREKLG